MLNCFLYRRPSKGAVSALALSVTELQSGQGCADSPCPAYHARTVRSSEALKIQFPTQASMRMPSPATQMN